MNKGKPNASGFNPDAATVDEGEWGGGAPSPGYNQQAPRPANRPAPTFNPDGATVDEGDPYGQPAYNQPAYQQPAYNQPAYKQPAYQQAPRPANQPAPTFNPDGATVDEGDAYGQPVYAQPGYAQPAYQQAPQPAYQQAPQPANRPAPSFNPDAPTSDSEQAAPAPFKRNAAFDPNAAAAAVNVTAAAAQIAGGGKGGKGGLPFKRMSGANRPQQPAPQPAQAAPAAYTPPAAAPRAPEPAPRPSHTPSYTPPAYTPPPAPPVPEPSRRDMPQPDHRSFTLREMEKLEDRRFDAEMQNYNQAMAKWKGRLWIPIALVVGLLVLVLLGGAFAGAVGAIFVVIAAAAATAILFATGKMKWLSKPKKPQKQTPTVETPELTSVYSVRLRLKSMNLPKPIEVVIRKEEQLLGCDKVLCIQPLDYRGISHKHCTIISKVQHGHTEYYIRDESSKNGTRLNERKLDAGVEYPLQIGDVITLAGRYQFRVLSDAY